MSIGILIGNGTQLRDGHTLNYNTKIKDIYEDWSLLDPYMGEHLDVLDLMCEFFSYLRARLIDSHAKRHAST